MFDIDNGVVWTAWRIVREKNRREMSEGGGCGASLCWISCNQEDFS